MTQSLKGTIWGGGVTFSASPATEIVVPTGYLVNESNIYDGSLIARTITIPNGVRIIEVYASANDGGVGNGVQLTVSSNNKEWLYGIDDYYEVSLKRYIGVTPNKQYTVKLISTGDGNTIYELQIKYSPEINKKTPDIYDY